MSTTLDWLRTLRSQPIGTRPLIVAEIKQRSPYGWVNSLWWERQLDLCEEVGDIISAHTDELWGGSLFHLAAVRRKTSKPILAKGFHPTVAHVKQALEVLDPSTDWVLTVGWDGGSLRGRCWYEVESLDDLRHAHPDQRCVWNARNPRTGERRMPSALEATVVWGGWLCQASLIRGPQDVVPSVDAILIGEGLYT